MGRQNLQRKKGHEPIQIKNLFHGREAGSRVALLAGCHENIEHCSIVRIIARCDIERIGNILAEPTIEKISIRIFEMALQQLFVPALDEDEKAQSAPIQFYRRVCGARSWNSCGEEQFARNLLGNVTGILHRIVQVNLLQAMEFLPLGSLIEIQGQGRLAIDGPKAAEMPFEVK